MNTGHRLLAAITVGLALMTNGRPARAIPPPPPPSPSPEPSSDDETWRGPAAKRRVGAIELGLRVAYAVPMGVATGAGVQTIAGQTAQTSAQDLANLFSGRLPFALDLGFRAPNVFVGLFASYAILFPSSNQGICATGGSGCSGHEFQFGGNVHWHFAPRAGVDPWVGLGIGYEWATLSVTQGTNVDLTFEGIQFVNTQLGVDFKDSDRSFGFGPFLMASVGQYDALSASGSAQNISADITNKTLHEWITFGLRGAYDFPLTDTKTNAAPDENQ